MKFVRFAEQSAVCQGVIKDNTVEEITGDMFTDWTYTGRRFLVDDIKLLAPLEPKQIIGIGANFVKHPQERPETLPQIPVFFFKPVSSVIGPDEEIVIPAGIEEVKFESELAVVIGKETKNISKDDVLDHVFGCTVGNDVTAPQYLHEDGHWMVGKSFDTFTPLGPCIETDMNPLAVSVEAKLDGDEKQNSSVDCMIVPIQEMIAYLSHVMTLQKGDVILTGSPLGAEMTRAGSTIECEIKDIGVLKNRFVKAKQGAASM
ncbi:2-keto-4-pentenoate hydratase/2-oxohepta-3-ene-1,7-dioic acid hydratase (catechol pathway) [Alteribacillus persepolensis]|uniref:2-keto-4-pentenoate hydratase/2-oxohepta-3-ene-1,7-dioic acid hydratase (Catechol pathway) n=1 Tax=Alteribacillus persepolensis TaxID=568899 RepID=A0A1G8A568_9BACI|nr:fumarylacetoacetate hydrolase family protein [Alteribacillus persepolensis]SDH16078.1 2-keto-4-pentenoate hydratase/2-oxohepta-3-ene-1,7-dioic acid hydratase (catechol pathway) [Alteribacillus persepolensis]